MKSFDRLREQSLEEKLKSSDPTGKWVSDFVHSDNPKFAGKSKKERIRMALGAAYAAKRQNEEVEELDEAVHRIGLTVTDPNHPMVSKRKETIQKTVRITSDDREKAINSAKAHYRRKGYKVHDHHYIGTVNEEAEQVDEADDKIQYAIKHKMSKKILSTHKDLASAKDEWKGIDKDERHFYQVVSHSKPAKSFGMKEETELDEGLQQTLRKVVPGYAKRELNKKMDAQAYAPGDSIKKTVDKDVNYGRYKKIADKLKKEEVVDEGKIKVNFKMPPESLADKMARKHAELRKKSGLPDPEHYKNLAAQKKKELDEGSIEKGGESDLTGTWSSKTKKGQSDMAPPVPNDPIDKNAKDTTTIKTGLGDLNKAFDKIDKENAAKKKATKEEFNFSTIRNKLVEAKKMKGEDPCWDDYKMIGTKMKNGKQVPNCVPKESVAEGKEEQEYDYEGDMAMSDLRSILHNAKTVHDMLEPNTNIPEWCQSKITLAEDYISTVANYMRGEMSEEVQIDEAKPGLYANIHAKRKRIKGGSGERMRNPGAKGAPTAQAFKDSAKTAKK